MARMKKAVQRILEANQLAGSGGPKEKRLSNYEALMDRNGVMGDESDILHKKQEVERFQDKTRRLVEVMKVPDLTYIPVRYRTVMELGLRFEKEQRSKIELRDQLLRQQNMLNLILCHFLYTGQQEHAQFLDKKNALEKKQVKTEREVREYKRKMEQHGALVMDVRMAILAILERFEDTPIKMKKRYANAPLTTQLKIIHKKLSTLMDTVAELEEEVPESDEESNARYHPYIKHAPIPHRLIRVGTPIHDEESDEDEFTDLKVPGREEIKAKSLRFMNQAKLKKGIR